MQKVHLNISDEEHQGVKALAERLETTMTEVIRSFIRAGLDLDRVKQLELKRPRTRKKGDGTH